MPVRSVHVGVRRGRAVGMGVPEGGGEGDVGSYLRRVHGCVVCDESAGGERELRVDHRVGSNSNSRSALHLLERAHAVRPSSWVPTVADPRRDDPLASGTPPTLQSRSSWTRREDLFAEPFSNGAAPSDAHGFDWKSNIWSSSTNEVEVESDSSPYASTSALPIATSLSRQRRTSTEGIIGNSDESNHFGASITPQAYGFSPFAQAEASSNRLSNDVESSQDGFDEEDEEDEEDISELGPDEVFSLLQEACTSGDLRGVRRVMRGSSLPLVDRQSSSGMTPLHYAASRGRLPVVRYLIETCGATQIEDGEGETALHKAAYSGHFDVVRRLVEAGWRVDAADTDGWTPLHNAASRGYLAIVRYLVGSSLADQDAQSKLGFTPLMSAAAKGYLPVVQYLIKNRANPLLRNSFLETALEIAAGIFEVHICRLLAESEKASLPEPSLYNSFLLHTTVPVLVYENQRLAIPAIGRQTPRWTSKALSKNDARTAFTLASLGGSDEVAVIKDTIGLPVVGHETSLVLPTAEVLVSTMVPSEPAWFWLSDWTTDLSDPRSSPVDGWSYARSFDATVWTAEPSDELQVLLNGNGSAFGGGKKWVRRRLAVRLLRRRVDLEPWGFGEEGEATTSATDYLTKVQLLVVGLHHNGGNRAGSVRSSRTVPVVDEAEREVERRKRCARLESAITSLAQGIATDSVEARRSRATEELKKYEVMLASLRLDRAEDEEGTSRAISTSLTWQTQERMRRLRTPVATRRARCCPSVVQSRLLRVDAASRSPRRSLDTPRSTSRTSRSRSASACRRRSRPRASTPSRRGRARRRSLCGVQRAGCPTRWHSSVRDAQVGSASSYASTTADCADSSSATDAPRIATVLTSPRS